MSEAVAYCSRCGAGNGVSARWCAHCGSSLGPSSEDVVPHGFIYQSDDQPVAVAAPGPPIFIPPPVVVAPSVPHARYGGFWIRFVAVIIDWLIVQAVVAPVSFILGATIGVAGAVVGMPGVGIRLVAIIVGGVLGVAAFWVYEAAMESSSRQATLGKMAFSLKVTDLAGQRISFARATGRHFAKFLSGLILCAGYIMAGFTERKQALHDMIAGTLVQCD
jgi:uncharacterized RDD family membrane protein YckC